MIVPVSSLYSDPAQPPVLIFNRRSNSIWFMTRSFPRLDAYAFCEPLVPRGPPPGENGLRAASVAVGDARTWRGAHRTCRAHGAARAVTDAHNSEATLRRRAAA